jgi:putative ABC transport system permease protein
MGLSVASLSGAAFAQSGDPLTSTVFGVVVGALALSLWAGAQALLRAAATLPRSRLPALAWHGASALTRPGSGVAFGTVALGLGTLVLTTLSLVQGLLSDELAGGLPRDAATMFLLDVQPAQLEELSALVRERGAHMVDRAPIVMARLRAVDGVDVTERLSARDADPNERRREDWLLTREQRITIRATLPDDNEVVEGKLFALPDDNEVSLEHSFARDIGAQVGSTLTFDVQGVQLSFHVTSLREVRWRSFALNFFIVAEPGPLDDAPQHVLGAVDVDPAAEQLLQDAVWSVSPTSRSSERER